jgi:hypothetical protein
MPEITDAEVHDRFCALASSMDAGSRMTFRYLAGEDAKPGCMPFVLAIEREDLGNYLGVRGFRLLSDVPDDEDGYRIAVAERRADRRSCCKLKV